jgi:hypothetical protein
MKTQAATTLSPQITSNVMKWVNLSWIRCAIDGVSAILFLRAASYESSTVRSLR